MSFLKIVLHKYVLNLRQRFWALRMKEMFKIESEHQEILQEFEEKNYKRKKNTMGQDFGLIKLVTMLLNTIL